MKIPGLTINESSYKLENGQDAKLAVFIYTGNADPKPILDYAVKEYVGENGYHELIDAHLDNPWTRVILSEINGMNQEEFDPEKHKLVEA